MKMFYHVTLILTYDLFSFNLNTHLAMLILLSFEYIRTKDLITTWPVGRLRLLLKFHFIAGTPCQSKKCSDSVCIGDPSDSSHVLCLCPVARTGPSCNSGKENKYLFWFCIPFVQVSISKSEYRFRCFFCTRVWLINK